MVAIFYNKRTLNDVLIISISNNKPKEIYQKDDFVYGIDEQHQNIFINVFNLSKYLSLPEGYLYLTEEIQRLIKTKLDIDLVQEKCPFIVGRVISATRIQGTHLHLCDVNVGKDKLTIVCGAKNVRSEINVVVAQIGTVMPNGSIIAKNKLMGYESYGMICSFNDLGIQAGKNIGIIELSKDFVPGDSFTKPFANIK